VKKTDIAMIMLIVSISLVAAYFIMSGLLGKYNEHSAKVQTIDAIGDQVGEPDPRIFHRDAINPTIPAIIGSTYEEED
jgi:hypothetical protein